MVNYYAAAAALRFFSLTPDLRALYRRLGNRKTTRPIIIEYARAVWEEARDAGCLAPQSCLLELGTGWTHANSLYLALVGEARIVTFDVIDNRSLPALQAQIPVLLAAIEQDPQCNEAAKGRARERSRLVLEATDFPSAYAALNMEYQVRDSGLPDFEPGRFDMIYAVDVLEHVRRDMFQEAARRWRALLKPGGRFSAQVGLDDHLAHYDARKHPKHYLRHSDWVWRLFLENELQYINRMSASEIVAALELAGFEIVNRQFEMCDIAQLPVHACYQAQSKTDLAAVRLLISARVRG